MSLGAASRAGRAPGSVAGAFLAALLLCTAAAGAQDIGEDAAEAGAPDLDPVNVNTATLDDLMALPGMDADLARAILAWRHAAGSLDSVECLYASPAITPSRLMVVRPWLVAARGGSASLLDVVSTLRNLSSGGSQRREIRLVGRRGPLGMAARLRRDGPATQDGAQPALAAGALRIRAGSGLSFLLGDQAPVDGLGILIGLSNRPPPQGVRAIASEAGLDPWILTDSSGLARPAPLPTGRYLRGGSMAVASRVMIGAFRYHAGSTENGLGDEEPRPARVTLLGGACPLPWRGSALLPRLAAVDGRVWRGACFLTPLSGVRLAVEAAWDPTGRHREAMTLERGGGRLRFLLSQCRGSVDFVNPLGLDSERAPVSVDQLDSGRNDNRNESAAQVRLRLTRRLALECEVRAATDRATSRRSWDRPSGYGRLRLEGTLGGGWSAAMETRLEARGAPGPSTEADPPLRRHVGLLKAGRDGRRSHLRFDWQGGLDIHPSRRDDLPATLDGVKDLLAARGRWRFGRGLWVGGGVARFQVAGGSLATLYEERPAGYSPAVTVRGDGRRLHAAFEGFRGPLGVGGFVAREIGPGASGEVAWGFAWGFHLRP